MKRAIALVILLILLLSSSCGLVAVAYGVLPQSVDLQIEADFILPDGIEYLKLTNPVDAAAADYSTMTQPDRIMYVVADNGNSTDNGRVACIIDNTAFYLTDRINRPIKVSLNNSLLFVLNQDGSAIEVFDAENPTNIVHINTINFENYSAVSLCDFVIFNNSLYTVRTSATSRAYIDLFGLPTNSVLRSGQVINLPVVATYHTNNNSSEEIKGATMYGSTHLLVLFSNSVNLINLTNLFDNVNLPINISNPIDIATDNSLLYVTDANGILVFNNKGDMVSSLLIAPSVNAAKSGELKRPWGISIIADKIYVTDTATLALQRFVYNGSTIVYDNMFFGSFSYDIGRLYEPSAVTVKDGITYIADTKNNRLQVWADNTVLSYIDLGAMPTSVAVVSVSGQHQIYVVLNNSVIRVYSQNGEMITSHTQSDGQNFGKISAIAASMNGSVFIADFDKNILCVKLSQNNFFSKFAEVDSPAAIAVSARTSEIYTVNSTGIKIIDIDGKQRQTVDVTDVDAIALDYLDNIFVIDSGDQLFRLRYDSTAGSYTRLNLIIQENPLKNANALFIDDQSGRLIIADTFNHCLRGVSRDDSGAVTPNEIPNLAPPVALKPFNDGHNNTVKIGKVLNYPSNVIYPVDISFQSHQNYCDELAFDAPTNIAEGQTFIILFTFETDEYHYVLYENKVGFILKSGVEVFAQTPPPYTQAQTLHSNARMFRYPSLLKSNAEYVFEIALLEKNTPLTIINTVSEYQTQGIYWYEVTYADGNDTVRAYVPRYLVTQNKPFEPATKIYAKVTAPVNVGYAPVFDVKDATKQPFANIRDRSRVLILADDNDGWYYIEATDIDGNIINGYVEAKYVTFSIITPAQIIGIVLLVLTMAVGVITILTRKPPEDKDKPTINDNEYRL